MIGARMPEIGAGAADDCFAEERITEEELLAWITRVYERHYEERQHGDRHRSA